MVEFYLAKVKELWKDRKEYDNKFEEIKKATWKKSFSDLKSEHRKYLESENDFRYGWPWKKESFVNFSENKKYFPKISILTPSFNSAGTIEKAILSVLNQGYPNFEHIITDAGSIDGTVDILKKYPHLKWVSEPDKGQSDAMNKAFDMSDGEVISYLNADDYYSRGAFNEIAKEFTFKPETEMVVGNLYFEYGNHTYLRNAEIDYRKIMLPFKYMFPINPVSYFYRRKVQTDVGPFPLDNHYTMDYWFLLKAYQNHKLYKTEYNLGTFCMNGYNKTSNADNRKNTHIRVVYHCRKYDLKNLPYYLYNYNKFFYYDKKPYNLKNIKYKLRKNAGRIKSILTLKKNKYYNEKLYTKARNDYYASRRIRASFSMLASFIIYPKSIRQNSRLIMFSYSVAGLDNTEKLKWFYNFLTTPPGLPLANKLHYYGNKFISENKSIKGNSLLVLTYIISPKFLFKADKNFANHNSIESNESKLGYLNPLNWIKGFVNYFRYKTYKDISYNYYLKAGERYFHHKNIQSVYFMILSFLVYPLSIFKKSRLNTFAYSALGNKGTSNLKILYHIFKDNPEYTLSHKLNYYGNEFKNSGQSVKGNLIILLTCIISPKYISASINNKNPVPSSVSDKTFSHKISLLNPVNRIKGIVNYFRYKKYKDISYDYYIKAGEKYYFHKNVQAVYFMMIAFLIYPLSVTKKSRLNLFAYSFLGNTLTDKFKYIYHLYKDDPEYTFAYKLNYHGNELRKEGSSFKGNSILIFAYILSPKYIKKREKINKSKIIYASEYEVPKMNISGNRYSGLKQSGIRLKNSLTFNGSLNNKIRNTTEILRYKFVQIYHYFKYRKFKAKSKELYMRAQESYIVNKRFDTVKFLIPSFILYPVSIFKRNKWSLMINSILGNSSLKKAKGNKEE
ncbi:MAG: glycosyltransferase [Ignavibacteria bacterium]|nr:glycosyltransferase [Ignavibacteria bacterium]